MKSVRKWPQNYFLHRQLRKYTELTQKGEEALFTLQDLLSRERKAERSTALIQESLGRVYHLMLDDDKAFKAYCNALNEDSDSYDAWHYGKN